MVKFLTGLVLLASVAVIALVIMIEFNPERVRELVDEKPQVEQPVQKTPQKEGRVQVAPQDSHISLKEMATINVDLKKVFR